MVIGKMGSLFESAPRGMHFVSITIDPTRDTPLELKKYAERFDADPRRWHFLTGSPDVVRAVVTDGFKVAMPTGLHDLDRHSVRLILVDQEGDIRGYFSSTDPDEMARLRGILDVYRGS
jgi:protein SCO1/2